MVLNQLIMKYWIDNKCYIDNAVIIQKCFDIRNICFLFINTNIVSIYKN